MRREHTKVIWALGLVALQVLGATGCRIKRAGTAGQNEPDQSVPESFGAGAPNDSNTGKAGYGPSPATTTGNAAGTLAPRYGGVPAVPEPGSARMPDSMRVRLPSLDTTITVPARGTGAQPFFTNNNDNRGLNGSYGATASSTSVAAPIPIASPSSLSTPAMSPSYAAPRIPPPTMWPVTPVAPGSSGPPPPKPPGAGPP